jgi:Family of unknown function (DUF5677)
MAETYREKLYPLCERMLQLVYEIIDECELVVTKRGLTEPKLLVMALLSRSLMNFKGVVLLIKQRMPVEARVLTRCCYENMFMVGGLHVEGETFADKMIADEHAGRKGRVRFMLETEGIFEALSADVQETVKEAHDSFRGAPKLGFLKPKDASGVSVFKESYIAYSQFSGDAAHPTLSALKRHLSQETAMFDVAPQPKEDELDETLHLACIALIGTMVVVNEMNGFTEAGKKLPALNGELVALQTAKYGARSVAEGMEIRTARRAD